MLTHKVHCVNCGVLYSIDPKFKPVCRKGVLLQTDSSRALTARHKYLRIFNININTIDLHEDLNRKHFIQRFFTIMFIKGPAYKAHDARTSAVTVYKDHYSRALAQLSLYKKLYTNTFV